MLDEKRLHGEVTETWFRERSDTMGSLLQGENDHQSRLTSEYTFLGPLRHYVSELIAERCADAVTSP
ncbi:MAG: hypothetical protein DMF59_07185 [Acidobacteria bacterium]|nr:MAG: hypothetical protein DMF59_07185 [Acidobacteriota bacterium]